MKTLFQYAVILHEYQESETEGRKYLSSRIIIEPKYILAKNQSEVAFKATREIPEDVASNPEDVQILVKNF